MIESEYQNTCAFDFLLLQNTVGTESVTPSIKNYVALLPWFRDCDFDSSVSSNVRCATCSHGTDCHAESPAGKVQCFKMAKIDPVSPFYPILWLKKAILQRENLQDIRKTSHWAVNIYLCAFRNWKCELLWCLTEISFT